METNKIYLANAYEKIKEIPDHSIDLIYTDIPYLIGGGGGGASALSQRIEKNNAELGNEKCIEQLKKRAADLKEKMDNATSKSEYEKWHSQRGNVLNKINLLTNQNITTGIDYSILDEFVRISKHIYIYIYGAVKNKSMT